MTPALRSTARRRFPNDPMLTGEDVIGADGRFRAFTPMRLRLFTSIRTGLNGGRQKSPYICAWKAQACMNGCWDGARVSRDIGSEARDLEHGDAGRKSRGRERRGGATARG